MVERKKLVLDPAGYFLIRIRYGKIEVGFCEYKDMIWGKKNKVLKKKASKNPQEILDWIKKNKLYSRKDHYEYMKKELNKAKRYIASKKKYVQS